MPLMSTPDWPDHLDALIAAPAYHSLLFENETVRVVETHVPAGHTVPLHTHCWSGVQYIVSWSDFVRRDSQGAVLLDTRLSGRPAESTAAWSGPLAPHTLENVGGAALRVIGVEIKNAIPNLLL